DPQGRLVFSGPVETKEELDKLPAEVRQRYDKLEQKDIPAVVPTISKEQRETDAENLEEDDDDNDSDDSMQEVSLKVNHTFLVPPRRHEGAGLKNVRL
ncbi:MAG: hypothetical protein M3Q89_04185, partial [Verrucomicrobiota bacterium]|nr:hypothetical protein [Verrucomicrobiota bacterium]